MSERSSLVIATDTCVVTVTPVLTDFKVVIGNPKAGPRISNDPTLKWIIDSASSSTTRRKKQR